MEETVFYQIGKGVASALFPLTDLGADTGHPATVGTPFTLAQNLDSPAEVDEALQQARADDGTVRLAAVDTPDAQD